MNVDPRVMAFFPECLSRSASDAMADRIRALMTKHGWGLWAVELKQTQTFIGCVGLHIPTHDFSFNPCVEIGWRLMADYWGSGYATEAAQAALQTGFDVLELEEIVSFTALLNRRSQALMERLGMQREAWTFEHPALPSDSPLREHCLYRLDKNLYQNDNWRQGLRGAGPDQSKLSLPIHTVFHDLSVQKQEPRYQEPPDSIMSGG
ncbi:MAG TPA: GNAT family N-acetyltransferase [Thiolinea sp.]|nr:GNAT family N-acetyltransferase [Thiolinea sp.]